MKESIVATKSVEFALNVISMAKELVNDKKEFVLSRQVVKSGTAIGALIREAEHAESKADFLHKMNIALKEANETLYWLELLVKSLYLTQEEYEKLNQNCEELVRMLASIVKTTKSKLGR